MDPPLVNESSFSQANPASYSLSEIWPFSSGLGLRVVDLGQNSTRGLTGDGSINRDGSAEDSTVTEVSASRGGGAKKRRDMTSQDESSKILSTSCDNDNAPNNSNGKRMKTSRIEDENGGVKAEEQTSFEAAGNKVVEQSNKPTLPPKLDYIHVRARRGQATDSHSLAERARREKISERMKTLQDLVPGCNKVIGKSLVLDEIINYIQSLQHQVEFLSMKIEAVTSTTNSTIEGFPPNDVYNRPGTIFSPQGTQEYVEGSQNEWLHMQLGGNFERAT